MADRSMQQRPIDSFAHKGGGEAALIYLEAYSAAPPCEDGAMVSFSALMTCANGASQPGNGVVSARTRHGDTAGRGPSNGR